MTVLGKTHYVNGQRVWKLDRDKLTFYYKNGAVKAAGRYSNDKMQGDWTFYRESGQLVQTRRLENNTKEGRWIRYDKNGKVEYDETFVNGKVVKR